MANKTFTDKQKEIVARKLGYDGPMAGFEKFVKSDPAMERKLNLLTTKFMARGGAVRKFAVGGNVQGAVDSFNAAMAAGDYSGAASIAQNAGYSAADVATYVNANAGNLGLGPSTGFTGVSGADVQSLYSAPTASESADLLNRDVKGFPESDKQQNESAFRATASTTTEGTTGGTKTTTTTPTTPYVDQQAIDMLAEFDQATARGDTATAKSLFDKAVSIYGAETSTNIAQHMLGQFDQAMNTAKETGDTSNAVNILNSALGIFEEGQSLENMATYLNENPNYKWLREANDNLSFTASNLKEYLQNVEKEKIIKKEEKEEKEEEITTEDKPGAITTISGGNSGVVFAIPPIPKKPGIPSMEVAKLGTPGEGQEIVTPESIAAAVAQARQAGTAAEVAAPTATAAPQIDAVKAQGEVQTAVAGNQAVTGTLSQSAQAAAAEADPAETALKSLEAAKLTNPQEVIGVPKRTLEAGELVSGPAVNMAQVDAALNKAEAATAAVKPEMTVQGQLDKLLVDFDSGNPPAWAASSMRNANAVLAARGLGASSLAGQAIIQATLEAAIPIAAQDAQTVAALELQNLSNRQQTAVLVAQQRAAFLGQEFDQAFQTRVLNAGRIADIANLNFTAEQTIAIENARLAQTVDLANLSNEQGVIMARAAQIANLESANLNNRQQAALQNAQAFLQLDLTNLNNQQQTALFNAEKVIQSIFTDTAAENAAKQFNAASQVQVQQFYDSLSTQVGQFNATQKNAMEQFNVSQENALSQFNAQQSNAMQQFNAQNRLIVDQSNAEWRRQIATIDTAAQNTANQFEAQAGLQINMAEYNNMWQTVRDTMEYAFKASQGYLERQNTLAVAVLQKEAALEAAKYEALGALSARVLGDSGGISGITSSISGGIKNIKDILGIGSAIADFGTGSISADVVSDLGLKEGDLYGSLDFTEYDIDAGQGGFDFYGNPIEDYTAADIGDAYWGGSD